MKKSIMMAFMVVLVVAGLSLTGCGPSAEERTVMKQFNQLPELIEKGLYVKKIEHFEGGEEKVFEVEAELVNEEGVVVGRLKSERVEGFGTRKPRILMYTTPGVSEEWNWEKYWEQNGGRRGGRGGRGRGGDRNRQEEKKTNEN